ncbi:hypothetical protein AC579_9509 [Pseudocercospora musae]|uniref:Apple domain-containing protein n=1 Tax=Pseudocercospora musae TaxID=113226 RepID=A0A139INA2_9PEZI|nr:hypothetical protein AC579_9509 [Pseudocercospora musae]
MAKHGFSYTSLPPEASGPEVVHGSGADGMIPVPKSAAGMDSPEVYQQYDAQHHQFLGQQNAPGYNHSQEGYSSSSEYNNNNNNNNNEKWVGVGAISAAASTSGNAGKRKRWIWVLIGAILLALAVGLGLGLGVGLSQSNSDKEPENQSSSQGDSGGVSNSTSSLTASATASATSSAVTSGSTGLAEFSCNSTETTESESGTQYVQECYTQFQVGHPSYYSINDSVTMKNLGGKITVYTFQDCLDKCDEWNSGGNNPACRAVTYYANLTAPIQMWGGNCFLKNDRGNGYQTDPVDYPHTASAFQSCLNQTCWADN